MGLGSTARPAYVRFAAALAGLAFLAVTLAGCGLAAETATDGGSPATARADKSGGAQVAPSTMGAAQEAIAPAPGGSGKDAATVPASQKLIVRNKTLRIEVEDIEGTIAKVRDLTKRDGADITQMQVSTAVDEPIYRPVDESGTGSTTALRAYVTIRVPADKYAAFIDDAAKLGTVKFQTETADDVTQQHIDLSARLTNLRAEEAQLREFFLKAKNVTEMLQIEQELARVRGEIESLAAQVAYLERQAAMATVTLELTEPKPLVRPSGIDWGTASAFTNSVRAFVTTFNVLLVMLGPILAIAIFVALPAFLVARFAWKRYKKRQAAKAPAADSAE